MRTGFLLVGLVLFAFAREVRRQARISKAVLTQSSNGKHAKKAHHAGRYNFRADVFGAFSGHGIGWGTRTAL